MTPAILPFGDTALVVEVTDVEEAHRMGRALEEVRALDVWRGLEDIVIGYGTLTLISDPLEADLEAQSVELASLARRVEAGHHAGGRARRLEIPVAFDGPDLADVATAAGTSETGVFEMLLGSELFVAFVGFAPGFAYLEGLPAPLARVPRRTTARTAVPAGSVALAGGFAAVYPQATPGGWNLVGRTSFPLFDSARPPFAALRAGDSVQFVEGPTAGEVNGGEGAPSRARLVSPASERWMTVTDPGPLSTVQDLGRIGVASLGVPRAGAADPYSLRIANRLVGNREDAAGIEVTLRGAALRFHSDAHAAVVGDVDVVVDGTGEPPDTVLPLASGQELRVGNVHTGSRAVIAVSGGIGTGMVLGSRSSDTLCGLGLGPLIRGDEVPLGTPGRPRGGARHVAPVREGQEIVLRVLSGLDASAQDLVDAVVSRTWMVAPESNRVGVRLQTQSGEPVAYDASRSRATSRGMVTGAVQLPPDGGPIVLSCDHATVGGFPVVATVASADLGRLGQCRPGQLLRMERIDLAEATAERARLEREIARVAVGWYPG